jgi:hypothetical protein
MTVIRKSDGTMIADKVEIADNILKQMRGLMFRRPVPEGFAMVFDLKREQYIDIHMLFVRFPLDLVFLDKNKKVIDLRKGLKPWTGQAFSKQFAMYAIEFPAGTIDRHMIEIGDILSW